MRIIKQKSSKFSGQLGKKDIIMESQKSGGLKITPLDAENLKAASYDITPTAVALSTKVGMLETVYKAKDSHYSELYYIYVKPKDTVLIVSNEYIKVPHYMAGYVTSRVSNVVKGFGHISTTIDPNWNGAVLIALSNPSNRPIKIYVGSNSLNPLATVTFHYLNSHYKVNDSEYRQKNMRIDLLSGQIYYKNRHGLKAALRYFAHPKRRKYTDLFFEYIEKNEKQLNTKDGWNAFLNEFSSLTKQDHVKETRACDCVIKENVFRRLLHMGNFFIPSFYSIMKFLTTITFIILVVLYLFGLISGEVVDVFNPFN